MYVLCGMRCAVHVDEQTPDRRHTQNDHGMDFLLSSHLCCECVVFKCVVVGMGTAADSNAAVRTPISLLCPWGGCPGHCVQQNVCVG